MAEVDTNMLADQHSDIRREQAEQASTIRREAAEHTNEVVKESLKESFNIRGDVKDTRHDILSSTGGNTDRLSDQATAYYIASQQQANEAARDLASLKVLTDANASRYSSEMALNIEKSSAAAALAAEKIATAVALGQSQLSKEIMIDGNATRALINDLKTQDYNRMLIERNAEIVEERHAARHWRGNFDQSQWAGLSNQLQAFQSQLQETRQGMVNFGTMAGVGQSSTSNNVR